MLAHSETKPARTIPFPREFPLIGSLAAFNKNRLYFFLRLAQEYGDVCGFHFGPFPIILFNRPEHVHSIFVEHTYDFDKGRAMHNAIQGNGIFISEGEFHRRQRKLMAPPFQPRQITAYADIMVEYGERMQQEWSDGASINVNQQMTALTLSIIGKVLFDADVFTETDELGEAMTVIFGYTTYKLSHLLTPPLGWPTPRNARTRKAIALIQQRIQRMIDERRSSSTERNDFLSILLHARDEEGNAMSDRQLMDECITLFGAGHETTASALTWAWYLLCQHPDIYQKVLQEVDSVLQGRRPTYADLARLPYCLQVFKEAMRLYPPAYAISRQALHDMEIDGYPVAKGTVVMICPYALHRNPHYFPNPEKFDPERFTPEREKQLPRYAYLPFGAGPRICIGNYFAMMEGHLLLATLAQHATFTLVPGQTIKSDLQKTLALRPSGAVNVIVKRR
jgi:cytochrome P450